jgi:hypothetical protein
MFYCPIRLVDAVSREIAVFPVGKMVEDPVQIGIVLGRISCGIYQDEILEAKKDGK